ncbi:Agamous-like MADS-box protein AGL62 [Bienertia sinuspersici]
MADNERKTRGRQKVPLVRMEKESNRLVTFSKRRSGLFKKVSELCTLCGAEAAIIVFSPGRKAFSFGHPSVDATLNRFLLAETFYNSDVIRGQTSEPQGGESILKSNMQLTVIYDHFEFEKKRNEDFLGSRKSRNEEFEWISQAEELEIANLDKVKGSLSPIKNAVCHLYHNCAIDINDTNGLHLTGSDALKPAYTFPLGMVGGQNPVPTLVGDQPQPPPPPPPPPSQPQPQPQPHQWRLWSQLTWLEGSQLTWLEGPITIKWQLWSQLTWLEAPTIKWRLWSQLTWGSNEMGIDHLFNVNASANFNVNPFSSLPNSMGFGFPNPNLFSSFQGGNDPMGGQFNNLPPLPPMNMDMNPMSVNFQNYPSSSSQAGMNGMDTPTAPYNIPNGFGFGINGFY